MGYRDDQVAWRRRRIWQYCDMWTEIEITRELGLSRRTVNKYLRQLWSEGRIAKLGHFWIRS